MHGCQASAVLEGFLANTGHTVRNGDSYQATTARVFANTFISATCTLNGRKVMSLILE